MARQSHREGFTGYSRSNAGVYHDRLETARGRARTIAVVATLVAVVALAALGFALVARVVG